MYSPFKVGTRVVWTVRQFLRLRIFDVSMGGVKSRAVRLVGMSRPMDSPVHRPRISLDYVQKYWSVQRLLDWVAVELSSRE